MRLTATIALLIGLATPALAADPVVGLYQTQPGDTGSFAHVERFQISGTVDGKRVAHFFYLFAHIVYSINIETEVNKSGITPDTVFINVAWLPIEHLHQFNNRVSKKRTKSTGFYIGMFQQHPPES